MNIGQASHPRQGDTPMGIKHTVSAAISGMRLNGPLLAAACLSASVLMGGCSGSDSGTGGTGAASSATFSLGIADTPVDGATSVVVTFTGVQLQGGSGAPTEFDFATPKQIDLMTTSGGNAAMLLSGATIPAGNYQWIRLMVDMDQSTIALSDGTLHALTIPSGGQTGLKLVSGFSVAAGDKADFTIDFNLRKAVTLANGGPGRYILKPALRLINNQQVGQLAGSVSHTFTIGGESVASGSCGPAVYIYSGADVAPVDLNTASPVQPVTTATLHLNAATGDYDYMAAFLAVGDYTLAVTCAGHDDPDTADTIAFSTTKNAFVAANMTTTVNFP